MRFTIVFFFFLNAYSQVPKIISTALSADSTSIIITFSEPVYNSTGGSGNLETSDFTLSLCGGNATLLSSTPTTIAVVGNVYTLGLPLNGITNGFEKVTVWPSSSSAIYDASDNSALPSDYVTSGLLLDLNSKDCNSFSWTSTGNTLSTTWNDLSGNNNNFTTAGSPAYDINNGFIFANGQTADYFIKSSFPHPTTSYSDEFFIKTSRETNSFWKSYMVLGSNNESLIGYFLNSNDFYIEQRSIEQYYTGVGFADGNWHHLVITSDRVSGAEIIYLDGGLAYQSTRGAGALIETSGTYVIGQDQDNLGGGFQASQAFEGFIPVVRMYDKVLSPLEVTQNYNHISQYIENNNRVILNAGVSLDSDGDGIIDPFDSCPFVAGVAALNGCPWTLYIGNNYKTTTVSNSIIMEDEDYLCSLTNSGYYNISYHSGTFPEPNIGDFIVYNKNYSFPHSLLFDTDNFAFMKLRDFNKIIEVQKSNGKIIAIYNCQ